MSDILPFSGDHTGEYALVVAVLLAVSHVAAPWLRINLTRYTAHLVSFGGGLAVAYVFLQLIPEIEHAHELVGDRIHVLTLFSFLAFFGMEMHLASRIRRTTDPGEPTQSGNGVFWLHIAFTWIYTCMIVFTLPGEVTTSLSYAILGSLAIGLHVVYKGYVMDARHATVFEGQGRYILALAPIAGWLAHVIIEPSEIMFDVTIAILAGFLMQNVFREELPSHDHTRLRWMVVGAVVFLLLDLVAP